MQLPWIAPGAPPGSFPPVEDALTEPDGLLAFGGDLRPDRLLTAYRQGIFPWYEDGQPVLWWSPDPRAVIWPRDLRVSRSLRKTLRRETFDVRINTAFDDVVRGCAAPRAQSDDTWITEDMFQAYRRLHRAGFAHSIECWRDGALVGGLYGVSLGRVFCGESMFSRATDASKVALVHLCALSFELIDCQLENPHLISLGATTLARSEFVAYLDEWCDQPGPVLGKGPFRDYSPPSWLPPSAPTAKGRPSNGSAP